MLPKSQRLNLKKDFRWVASGKKFEGKYLKLFIKSGLNSSAKIGIALSRKDFPQANDRNRAKRLAAGVFQKFINLLPPSINIVVLPKTSISGVKLQDVIQDSEGLLKNAHLIG